MPEDPSPAVAAAAAAAVAAVAAVAGDGRLAVKPVLLVELRLLHRA